MLCSPRSCILKISLNHKKNIIINFLGSYSSLTLQSNSKVCLCDTNCRLSHKDPCPKWGLNHSEVVIRRTKTREYGKR
ncbi:hypothetical protein BWX40_12040 [Prevotella intermedia]|nr:hypothetical protein BWX40_12040 [Prevotella intermedia]